VLEILFADDAARLLDRVVEAASSDAEGLELEKFVVEGEALVIIPPDRR
jgi:hypothetical protein